MKNEYKNLFNTLKDPSVEVSRRIEIARSFGMIGDKSIIPSLKEFLKRQRISAEMYVDNDPLVEERLCDIVVVEVLHKLGDDSQWQYLIRAIAQSSAGLNQRLKEVDFAANAILKIGSVELIQKLIELSKERDLKVVTNAVKTLVLLKLPNTATHQPVPELSIFSRRFPIKPLKLADYFLEIEEFSKGNLKISNDVRRQIFEDNYQIADGEQEEITLLEFINEDIEIFGFTYCVDDQTIIICSFLEAASKWQNWWHHFGNDLIYQSEEFSFAITNPKKP